MPRGYVWAGATALALVITACSSSPAATRPDSKSPAPRVSSSPSSAVSTPGKPVTWAVATSAVAGGGMSALIAAARREGTLNVIALPPTFANYGTILRTFGKLYHIKINQLEPDVTSQQEITQIKQRRGSGQAADVLDVQAPVAVANASLFAPYQVATWSAIPANQKAPDGAWVQDYGGYMSVGYDPTRFGTITSLRQLLSRKFAHAIALDGSPAQATSALYGVMMANLALGGAPGNIATGVSFFRKLAMAGNLVSVPATTALTIKSGTTPVVINWDYLNSAPVVGRSSNTWKIFIPAGAALGSFYAQAVNKDAPHPAAARLWEEYLYSQGRSGGQNLWLKGGVRPVEQAAMTADHSVDSAMASVYPAIDGATTFLSPSQLAAAARYLSAHWTKAVG
ncbi:MAG TPA: ABC transporter substrate-binding protein [Streptosporangiaceae bacterium]|nr:ABC transporter substrate-binding protein [Streptosporangiaceae bacterium]